MWWAAADLLVGPVGRWLALASAFVLTGTVGFLKGMEYQQGKAALAEVQVVTKRIETIKRVAVGQEKISAAYERGRAERDEQFKKLQAEYEQNVRSVLESLPAVCTWSDSVVRLLNRARQAGGPAASSVKPDGSLPTPRSAYRWETRIGGAADDSGREDVFRVSTAPQLACRDH